MSNLVVSNISDGTTSVGTGYVVNGSAKAWVNFDGKDPIAARDSFNLSSLTDNGVGDYSVSWLNSMNNENYAILQSYEVSTNNDTRSGHQIDSYAYSSSGYRILTSSSTQSAADFSYVWTAILGDLA